MPSGSTRVRLTVTYLTWVFCSRPPIQENRRLVSWVAGVVFDAPMLSLSDMVPVIPLTVSQRRRDAKPQLVTLEVFPKALHAESWNLDRVRYTSVVKSFLAPLPR